MSKHVIGLDHIDLVVGNPEEMAAFMERAGLSVLRRTGDGRGSIEMTFPGSEIVLELTPAQRPDGSRLDLGLRHLALRCADLDRAVADLTTAGLTFADPPRVVPSTGRRVANTTDPDGHVLQFTE